MTLADNVGTAVLTFFNRSRRFIPGNATSWVILCGTTAITAIIVGTAFIVSDFRDSTIRRSETELANISEFLVRHFDQQFDELFAAQRSIAAFIEQQSSSSAEYAKVAASETLREMIEDEIDTSAYASSRINLFDSDGNIVASSASNPPRPINIADRDYFNAVKERNPRQDANDQITLVNSRAYGEFRVVLTRRLSAADGQFLGAITRTIAPDDLERFLSAGSIKGRTILLADDNGQVIARYGGTTGAADQSLLEANRQNREAAIGGVITRAIDQRSNEQSVVALRRLTGYPLNIIAATTMTTILASWSDETTTLFFVALLSAAVIGIMLTSIVWHLKEQARRLDVALNNMPQALLMFDPSKRLIVKNKRFADMFPLSEHVSVGSNLNDILRVHQDRQGANGSLHAYCESIRETLSLKIATRHTATIADGRIMQIVNQGLADGGWVSTIEDVTELRRSEELTVRLAKYDSLTGLLNRTSLMERLNNELLLANAEMRVAVLFLDLDEFKAVNDSLGHSIGDELLKAVARALESCIGPTEYIAHLGGDEFAFVLNSNPDPDDVLELVQRVFSSIRRTFECGGHSLTIDASIGIAVAPKDGNTCESLLRSADLAMYDAKALGKKTHRFFDPAMEAKAKERLLLETDLRIALSDGQIEAYFQPIYDLRKHRIVACEALARWRHPTRGFVSPAAFVPIAEQAGLIGQLGETILRQACREAARWPAAITVAVNVSPLQLRSPLFSLKVIAALNESGLPASRLEIEITEAVLISDDDTALKILHDLRAIGVRIALDDFGTGYSSLSYLLRFPFDKIKIDRSFVDGLTEHVISKGIVRAVIAMAAELSMITTAEGVETEAQRETLRQLGCDQIQGYLIIPATTGERISEFLNGEEQRRNSLTS